jgi:superfamily II DNA/RNA helicase
MLALEDHPQQKLLSVSFKDLESLRAEILRAVEELGFSEPTPIQTQAIPAILNGCDIQASAQTGTGKTAAYLIPTLQRLAGNKAQGFGPRALILVPTRELAMQVADEAIKYGKYLRTRVACIYGGTPYHVQNRQLSRPYDILVATPGRLIDHLDRGNIKLNRLEVFVLDEADRMLDMGFIEPVEQIAAATPKERQTLLFSATLKRNVLRLSEHLLNNPVHISIAAEHAKHENIEQRLHYVDNLGHKQRLLDHLLNDPEINQAIVFTSTKRHADQLVDELYEKGHRVAALHGDMNQRQRTYTIKGLRDGNIRVLVATDVAARGIDVQTITHVINFDLPMSVEDYVHRIGRTGRAGNKGVAFSFAAGKDAHLVRRIEQFTGQPITPHVVPGMEPTTSGHNARPKPARYRQSAGPQRRYGSGMRSPR